MTTQPTNVYDVIRVENRANGREDWIGTVTAPDLDTAKHEAEHQFECSELHSLVVSLAETETETE